MHAAGAGRSLNIYCLWNRNRMRRWMPLLLLLFWVVSGAQALELRSEDQVLISEPIGDDLIVSGGTIEINAPVESILAAGGQITVNAPIAGDVIAAGGEIRINGPVEGKIVAAGGTVEVNGSVRNAVLTGGTVRLDRAASIARDALISGGTVMNAGSVNGRLIVTATEFENTGSAGSVQFQEAEGDAGGAALAILSLLITLGFYLLGVFLILLFPGPFFAVESEVRRQPVVRMLVGWGALLVSLLLIVILAVTVVLLPFALIYGILLLVAVLLSSLFVSSSLGALIGGWIHRELRPLVAFTLGFVVLHILFAVPFFIGTIVRLVVVGLGIGAIVYALQAGRRRTGAAVAA